LAELTNPTPETWTEENSLWLRDPEAWLKLKRRRRRRKAKKSIIDWEIMKRRALKKRGWLDQYEVTETGSR